MPGSGDPFLEQLYVSMRDLTQGKRRCILATSGGADSMALMWALTFLSDRLRPELVVVSVDHGLQKHSAKLAAQVVALAQHIGLEAYVRSVNLAQGPGVEARAREARYRVLEQERKRLKFNWVVTAHTATDQAETLLMRLSRGSALHGAGGILSKRDRVIRPLLFSTRKEVRDWLKLQGETWHEDPMNRDSTYLRTRIRHEVLPALEASTDRRVSLRLARFARFASEDDALLQCQADEIFSKIRRGSSKLNVQGLDGVPPSLLRRVMVRWLEEMELPVDGELVERMRHVVVESGVTALPKRHLLKCRRGEASVVIE